MFSSNFAVTDPGGGSGGSGPPLSNLTLTTLRLKFLHRQDRISLFNWLIFLRKCAWHFSTKLNSRDIEKCNCFWYPLWSVRLCSQSSISRASGDRCSQIEIGRFCFLSWSTIMAISRPITTFFQPVKSSDIENETVNGEEAEAEATEFENGKLFYAFIPFPEKCQWLWFRSKHLYVCRFNWAFWFWCRSLSGRSSFKWCYRR